MHTKESIMNDLIKIGLNENDTVVVHSSLKQVGPVVGGVTSIILALEEVLSDGTIVMPTFTEHLCDPASRGSDNKDDYELIRNHMPIYYKDLTPVDKVNGCLTEVFRKQNGVIRSDHPHLSFASYGKLKETIIHHHSLNYALGEKSPLGKMYQLNAKILLLGAPKNTVSALHLSEYRVEKSYEHLVKWKAKILKNGIEQWVEYVDVDNDSGYFPALIDDYIKNNGKYKMGNVGDAISYLFPMVDLIDYGVLWLTDNRW